MQKVDLSSTVLFATGPVASLEESMRLGETLACVVCDAAVVVLEASARGPGPTCCGRTMVSARPAPCSARQPDDDGEIGSGTVAGSLYADEQLGLVVRCVRRGSGAIICSGRAMREIPAEVSFAGGHPSAPEGFGPHQVVSQLRSRSWRLPSDSSAGCSAADR